ncbi:organic hydroperoxide resistance protein [Robertkochia solimangrovi]|uniref:organic hydroperoxide resistance protein n=1 Tax=Robertkochia solimangrovi TaxID=2213046 RepID=UPI00117E5F5C|nr:organic hydroperoxide resistance protein [Robertkochia solimangrovi]TRZ42807.1 Ohr subfamily peroxiredoxin [Robertkochia solimangrovi]
MEALYKATATTVGGRSGHVTSDDGVLDLKLEVPKGLGGAGGEFTNPEQLFAAGYSACFGSALQVVAKKHKVDPSDFEVTVTVEIGKDPDDGGFLLSVIIDGYFPGVDLETGEVLINEAHEICPYSKATRDNIDVTLNLLEE